MSIWEEFSLESRIRSILDVISHDQTHHFGRPFLTAYQIAISFAERWPADSQRIGKPVGGKGTGQHDSLAQYIALELSRRIKNCQLTDIEGRFLHRSYLRALEYEADHGTVEASSGQAYDLSMFRLAEDGTV